MKKLFLFIFLCSLWACTDDAERYTRNATNKVALLQVDYLNYEFEGGKEYALRTTPDFTIGSVFIPPGDFGNIQLYYKELGVLLFEGSIIWAGLGQMNYPEKIDPVSYFRLANNTTPMPSADQFELVDYDEYAFYPDTIETERIWAAIENLEITQSYRASNPTEKIHLFLYTPSVGVGIPSDWDWYVILKN